ncbi:FadR/GntR family transcriptional regulator [Gracilibacillus phocaeensis]|uniref:FadR/GntR family transcriptional regulator n=1 Tax=Gracilibacillus phocaeensis TaxID=2042304 RepID=UPI00102FC856|nr:FadR/GntR family transcriptional regulator [Gracilibacillus phocaeensis]
MQQKRLSDSVADDMMSMIAIEKRFAPGDKLPNENELSGELNISRTTLREAIRILVANGIVEIRRGKGTYIKENVDTDNLETFGELTEAKINARDLYEMRLIFEPDAAYYATVRASETELKRILDYGMQIEQKIKAKEDRTEVEQQFHQAIVKATHNEFMEKLMPVIYQAINKGVILSTKRELAVKDTIHDHHMIMEFMKHRNPEGAKSAMKIHILHAMRELGIE